MSQRRTSRAVDQSLTDAVEALRRMREIVRDYHDTLIGIATQTRGKAAEAARGAIERQSGFERPARAG